MIKCPYCKKEISSYNKYIKSYYERNKERLNKAQTERNRKKALAKKELKNDL